jgi:hypothetical protein
MSKVLKLYDVLLPIERNWAGHTSLKQKSESEYFDPVYVTTGAWFIFQKEKEVKTVKSKKRAKKDPNAPKKALSAYMLWLNETRDEIKKEHPGISVTELSKKAGVLWKALGDKTVIIDFLFSLFLFWNCVNLKYFTRVFFNQYLNGGSVRIVSERLTRYMEDAI